MNLNLFTPRPTRSHKRVRMQLSDEDSAKILRGRWQADVTDQATGKRWRVRGAACSSPECYCDAVIVKELKQ